MDIRERSLVQRYLHKANHATDGAWFDWLGVGLLAGGAFLVLLVLVLSAAHFFGGQ